MNTRINQQLQALAESDYKAFNQKLIPTKYEIQGIRMPALKKLAKELAADPDIESYLKNAEYTTYEHILLTKFVHNKAIRKARESYRVTPEIKEHLSSMKVK